MDNNQNTAKSAHACYVSKTPFAGQRASVGRGVVVKISDSIRSGVIDGIDAQDEITIVCPGDRPRRGLLFVQTNSIGDVEAMPDLSWSWPARV